MKNQKISLPFAVITFVVAVLAISRLLPHPFNFSPVAALALFGGSRYQSRYAAWLVPLAAVWISDLLLNYAYYGTFVPFYEGAVFTYLAFAFIVLLGSLALKTMSARRLLLVALSASVIFFLVSNFGVWLSGGLYPRTAAGLATCYAAGIPFFRGTLAGDLIYSFAAFYGYELMIHYLPGVKTA